MTMYVRSKILILHYRDGELDTSFAASYDPKKKEATNIMGRTFPVGKVLGLWDLNAKNEKEAEKMVRGYKAAKDGSKLTPAQKIAWGDGTIKPADIIAKVEG
jgi:hypothetical protein